MLTMFQLIIRQTSRKLYLKVYLKVSKSYQNTDIRLINSNIREFRYTLFGI